MKIAKYNRKLAINKSTMTVHCSPFRKTAFFEFQVAGKFFTLCDPKGTPKINFGAIAALEVGSQGPYF